MKKVRLDEMTWSEVKKLLENGVDTVVIGIGSTEQHGPSLPLQTDRRIADTVANFIASSLENTIQAPTIMVGNSPHHMGFPGTISLKQSTLEAVLEDYLESLIHHGFKTIILTNHHGGNCTAIDNSLEKARKEFPAVRFVSFYNQNTTEAINKFCEKYQLTPAELGAHAGDLETSIMMVLDENLVCPDWFVKGFVGDYNQEVRAKAHREGYITLTENGVVGDQRMASKEKGLDYLSTLKEVILNYIRSELEKS